MKNEERAQLEAHYQNEIESIKGEVAILTHLLEHVLSSKNGKGISAQPLIGASITHIPITSQNLGAYSVTEQHFVPAIPIQPTQAPTIVDVTADGPSENRSTDFLNLNKISTLEERLRVVEGNNLIHPVIATEVCLVPNIMVQKEFRVPDFVKYTGLEYPYTHLWSYYNKMTEMIHNNKMLI